MTNYGRKQHGEPELSATRRTQAVVNAALSVARRTQVVNGAANVNDEGFVNGGRESAKPRGIVA